MKRNTKYASAVLRSIIIINLIDVGRVMSQPIDIDPAVVAPTIVLCSGSFSQYSREIKSLPLRGSKKAPVIVDGTSWVPAGATKITYVFMGRLEDTSVMLCAKRYKALEKAVHSAEARISRDRNAIDKILKEDKASPLSSIPTEAPGCSMISEYSGNTKSTFVGTIRGKADCINKFTISLFSR